jgi:hypothetical protein
MDKTSRLLNREVNHHITIEESPNLMARFLLIIKINFE